MYHRLTLIEEHYKRDVDFIQQTLNNSKYAELQLLVTFFMTTDINPYAFLPETYADGFDTSSGMSYLIKVLHHALYDDGEVSFWCVNGWPRIIFDSEYDVESNDNTNELIKINTVNDFIVQCNIVNNNQIMKCFIHMAAKHGIEQATKECSKYNGFDVTWCEELKSNIMEYKEKYNF